MLVRADLHIHSVLSPCSDWEMSPSAIVDMAVKKGLSLISITDHNSARNLPAAKQVAEGRDISLLYGMELQTREEVHVLVYFDSIEEVQAMEKTITALLPDVSNNPEFFGDQVVVDQNCEVLELYPRLLLNSIDMSLDELIQVAAEKGGLAVPAHVDRNSFSLYSQLGLVPESVNFAVEVINPREADRFFHSSGRDPLPYICSSDAHYLEDIGRRYTELDMDDMSLNSLKKAIVERKTTLKEALK